MLRELPPTIAPWPSGESPNLEALVGSLAAAVLINRGDQTR
jgi:RNA processing factor Prp31